MVRRVSVNSRSRAVGAWKRFRPPKKDKFFFSRLTSRFGRFRVRRKDGFVLKCFKAMRVYEVAALLITVFWFVGCGGSIQDSSRRSNQATVRLVPAVNRATAKFRHSADSPVETVQRFAIDGATRAVTAAAGRLGWCCPADGGRRGRSADASWESCERRVREMKDEVVLLWRSLHSDASRKEETCRLDRL